MQDPQLIIFFFYHLSMLSDHGPPKVALEGKTLGTPDSKCYII